MTTEQAIREIDDIDFYLQNHTDDYGESSHTAMMMAIRALKQYGALQEIRQEINKYYQEVNKLDDMLDFEKGLSLAYDTALVIIDKHIKEIEE